MTDLADLQRELAELRAQVAGLRDRQLPTVDRSSRRRDRRQTVLALSAVVLTLGLSAMGTASALDGSNTVFSDDIADGTIKYNDIAPGAVGSARVADNSLTSTDIKDESLSGNEILDGTVAGWDIKDASITSSDILYGSVGSNALQDGGVQAADLAEGAAYDKVSYQAGTDITTSSSDDYNLATGYATCPSGTHVISGGHRHHDVDGSSTDHLHLWASYADFDNNRWVVTVFNSASADGGIDSFAWTTPYAFCLK